MRSLRIGLVCPYSLDVAGGVQNHVVELAQHLLDHGHQVSVLAPAEADTPVADYVVASGRSVPLRFNGSVARVSFGPISASRTRRWLAERDFDLLHVHEPMSPSISLIAVWLAKVPVVATFHSAPYVDPADAEALEAPRALQAMYPMARPTLERLEARIAVSAQAQATVREHYGFDTQIIPNGVSVADFAAALPDPAFTGTRDRPVIAFIGRIDEPRKGLRVLAQAIPRVLETVPGARFLVVGSGVGEAALAGLDARARAAVEILGPLPDADKRALLASADVYVAPHLGGESFGMVLVEAMAAGLAIVASDLPAFKDVLDDGALGLMTPVGEAPALAEALLRVLGDPELRRDLGSRAQVAAGRYDWDQVAPAVIRVYRDVLEAVAEPLAAALGADDFATPQRLAPPLLTTQSHRESIDAASARAVRGGSGSLVIDLTEPAPLGYAGDRPGPYDGGVLSSEQ